MTINWLKAAKLAWRNRARFAGLHLPGGMALRLIVVVAVMAVAGYLYARSERQVGFKEGLSIVTTAKEADARNEARAEFEAVREGYKAGVEALLKESAAKDGKDSKRYSQIQARLKALDATLQQCLEPK